MSVSTPLGNAGKHCTSTHLLSSCSRALSGRPAVVGQVDPAWSNPITLVVRDDLDAACLCDPDSRLVGSLAWKSLAWKMDPCQSVAFANQRKASTRGAPPDHAPSCTRLSRDHALNPLLEIGGGEGNQGASASGSDIVGREADDRPSRLSPLAAGLCKDHLGRFELDPARANATTRTMAASSRASGVNADRLRRRRRLAGRTVVGGMAAGGEENEGMIEKGSSQGV
jgi:hypothetical protein